MLSRRLRKLAPALCGVLVLATSGCVLETPLAVRRVWFDYNTLRAPAFFYDKITHEPPHAAKVKEMRWLYGRGPHSIWPAPLIPPPRGLAPLPAKELPIGEIPSPGPSPGAAVPEPREVPQMPVPPAPRGPASAPRPKSSPPAGEKPPVASQPVPRTARSNGLWRFVH